MGKRVLILIFTKLFNFYYKLCGLNTYNIYIIMHSDIYKCIKISLHEIIHKPVFIEKIQYSVSIVHKITVHALQLLKLYFIYCKNNNLLFPIINRTLIVYCMK